MFKDRIVIDFYDPIEGGIVKMSLGQIKAHVNSSNKSSKLKDESSPVKSNAAPVEKLPEERWTNKKIRKYMNKHDIAFEENDIKRVLLEKVEASKS